MRPGRYKYAWDLVPPGTAALLDYGCHDGTFLKSLMPKCLSRYGCDVDTAALAQARRSDRQPVFMEVRDGALVPKGDESVDVITILDVLEHTGRDSRVIDELYRVLKPGGLLILSVPYKGLFACCDVGNVKFRYPRFHRFVYQKIL